MENNESKEVVDERSPTGPDVRFVSSFPGVGYHLRQAPVFGDGEEMRSVCGLLAGLDSRIFHRNFGIPEVKQGEHVIIDSDRAEKHDRQADDRAVFALLKGSGSHCCKRDFNWHPRDQARGDLRQYVKLHYIQWHGQGGHSEHDNLVTLCNMPYKKFRVSAIDLSELDARLHKLEG